MHVMTRIVPAILFLGVLASAQTADELIAKNIQAKGGIDKIKAINTLRTTARFEGGGGFKATIGEEKKRPDMVRQTFTLQGMTAVQAYDGSTGWQIQPFQGRKDPELMGEDDLRELSEDADFDGPIVNYKEKGNTVEYLGHDVVDGDDAYKLKVTLKNGDVYYYYLDPDSYLEIRVDTQRFIRGSVRENTVELGSYKPVAGVMTPFSIESGPKNNPDARSKITVEKVEANVPIEDSKFKMSGGEQPKPASTGK
jgi:hypothetical protein